MQNKGVANSCGIPEICERSRGVPISQAPGNYFPQMTQSPCIFLRFPYMFSYVTEKKQHLFCYYSDTFTNNYTLYFVFIVEENTVLPPCYATYNYMQTIEKKMKTQFQ